MFELNDKVVEIGTGVKGVVVDLDDTIDKPYGVLFKDVDNDKGVWWCDENMIKRDNKNNYDVDEFIKEVSNK